MNDIIFVKTRHQYDSYSDFWRLVELSGFQTVYVDQVDVELPVTYILSPHNGEWKSVIDHQRGRVRNARLINWNLERPGGSGGLDQYKRDNQQLLVDGYFDDIWVSDRELARRCKFSYVMLGGHKDFNSNYAFLSAITTGFDKMYDIIHLSYNSPRRSMLFSAPGVCKPVVHTLTVAPNAWGSERHHYLQVSKFMLNIHQDDHQYIEPLRFVIAAMYKLPIITEYCLDTYPYKVVNIGALELGGVLRQYFVLSLIEAVKDYKCHIHLGEEMYNLMTSEFTFRSCIEAVL